MFIRILPETTVDPASSTMAAMRWRTLIVRSVVWNVSVPSAAVMRMPERMGRVELLPMPFETTASAWDRDDWLTENFMGTLPLLLVLIYT